MGNIADNQAYYEDVHEVDPRVKALYSKVQMNRDDWPNPQWAPRFKCHGKNQVEELLAVLISFYNNGGLPLEYIKVGSEFGQLCFPSLADHQDNLNYLKSTPPLAPHAPPTSFHTTTPPTTTHT